MRPADSQPSSNALLRKYHLQPAPDSVARLARLVAQRMDENMEEIARVVSGDPVLKARLLRAASPRRGEPVEDVEQAIFRCGVEAVLVLAMTDPLLRAVQRTFESLFGLTLEQVEEAEIGPLEGPGYVTTVRFAGRATGQVWLRIPSALGSHLAGTLLSVPPDQVAAGDVADMVGELANVVAGNFQSNLCDAGLSCTLSVPTVQTGGVSHAPEAAGGRHLGFAFRCAGMPMMLNIVVESTD